MARRQVSIFINGREVANQAKAIYEEKRKIVRELNNMTIGTEAYEKKAKELDKVNSVITKHQQKIKGTSSAWESAGASLKTFAGLAGAKISADAIIGFGKEMLKTGSALESIEKRAAIVFGESLPEIEAAATKNAAAMGLTNSQYKDLATNIGDVLIPMGFQRDLATDMSSELVNLSGALSEWTNGEKSAAEVSNILKAALTGERESLKSLGIVINETDVKNRLAEKGVENLTGKFLEQAKAAATLELITEKSTDAQASYLSNQGTLIRQSAELTAKITNIKESIANLLIPVFHGLVSVASDAVDLFRDVASMFDGTAEKAKSASEEFAAQQNIVQDLESNLLPLIERYEELQGQTDLSKEEQEEMKTVIGQIAEIVPTAVTEFDKYGEALGINAEKAREFVSAQQLLLSQKNEEAIRKNTTALEDYKERLEEINKIFSEKDADGDFFKKFNVGGRRAPDKIKLTADEIRNLRAELIQLEKQIGTTETAIEILSGTAAPPKLEGGDEESEAAKKAKLLAEQQAAAKAEAAKKAAEKEAERAAKEAEREAAALQKKYEQLKEISDRYREEERLKTLTDRELEIAELTAKYDEEIEKAKELEAQKVEGATQLRLELEQQKRDALAAQQEEFRLADEEAKSAFRATLEAEVASDMEREMLQLEEHYMALLEQAEQFGFDSTELKEKWRQAEIEVADKYRKKDLDAEKAKIDDEIKLKMQAITRQAQIDSQRLQLAETLFSQLGGIVSKNEELQKALFLFEKQLAAAQIVVELQKQIALITTKYSAIPGGQALAAGEIISAKIQAGIGLATIAGTVIGKLTQKKKGGYHLVTGADDGITYNAKYIGSPGTGMLPDRPVVLASEAGREYFVDNPSLKNPVILAHVQAIENIKKTKQFADGGFTSDDNRFSPTLPDIANNTGGISPFSDPRMVNVLSLLADILQNGIIARLEDETIARIPGKLDELREGSGDI